jgi:cytochrome b561
MTWKNTDDRYGSASIAMHWLMFFLLVGVYSCIELREIYPKGSDPREALKAWHFTLGLSVFALVWLRLGLRLLQNTPRIQPEPGVWQGRLAHALHIALYLIMICMPLGGWLILSGEGKDIPFWGLQLPALMAENEDLAHTIEEIHETVGSLGYVLILVHTLAALLHHWIQRDNTLTRMLPNALLGGSEVKDSDNVSLS